MASSSSGCLVTLVRLATGAVLGGLSGAGGGSLAITIYPRQSFPSSSEGLTQFFFAAAILLGYVVVGAALGAVGGLCTGWRCRVGLGIGAAAGLAVGLGAIVMLPPVLDRWRPPAAASDLVDHGLRTITLSLILMTVGAVIGRVIGLRFSARAEAGRVAEAMNAWAEAELKRDQRDSGSEGSTRA